MEKDDFFFMKEALKEAHKAFEQNEVPIGAVIVYQNEIIASAYNLVESLKDATAHAEILCIKKASVLLNSWRLNGCTLYTTLEPCPMCAGALLSSRVDRVVWGASDSRQGACGSWIDLLNKDHPIHRVEVEEKILSDPSSQLLKLFFKERRLWNKSLKS